MIAALRQEAWLDAERWRRGGYLTTLGLTRVAHPELAMLNVPSVFAPWAQEVLTEIGEYVLGTGSRLKSGEVVGLADPTFGELNVTFQRIGARELTSPEFEQEMLLVLPLP